jgi:hypothetical protein
MLVFAPCSSTKRVPPFPGLVATRVRARSLRGFAKEWAARVASADARHVADHVYGGLGAAAARQAASTLGACLHYVSAGLSVIEGRSCIPGYDLTISPNGCVPHPIAVGAATPSEWWAALNTALGRASPLASAVRQHKGLVLVALSGAYLQMVKDDLLNLTAEERTDLRLILAAGSPVPADLEPHVIRYDQRLQNLKDAAQGASASFSQRALLHFASLVVEHPNARGVAEQRRLVEAALSRAAAPSHRLGRSATDAQISAWIRRSDPQQALSSSALLRRYRTEGLACELKRFFALVDATHP